MDQRTTDDALSPYHVFSRSEWAERREDTTMTLTSDEVTRVPSLHVRLDMIEVEEILPAAVAPAFALRRRDPFLDISRRRRGRAADLVCRPISDTARHRVARSQIVLSPREHPADPSARRSHPEEGREPPGRGSGATAVMSAEALKPPT